MKCNFQPESVITNSINKQELFEESMDDSIDNFDFEEVIKVKWFINKHTRLNTCH